ncbi:nitrilase [Siminovitchia terrae]|uniref:Nitrilase n=1 Tax=Siminovitchia terrae TaxID=1914933 RepID=A0ABQ4L574_SIMTE|nr:carbon-nitrogen hydrolase family protein [Siminovitchia terrae]GIN99041.1 nitrilase [Siminovitchia terrae]
MYNQKEKVKVAAVNASPYVFNLDKTVDKCLTIIEEAASNGARLVVFPETFLPMYPWWLWMSVDNKKRLELFKQLYYESVEVAEEPFQRICRKAKEKEVYIVIGINERERGTLYNTQVFINDQGDIIGKRRKLVPTSEERTVWGRGDGSDLFILDTPFGKMGGLICYENSMTLSRYALYSMGEQIHIANWPGSNYKSQPRDRTKTIETVSKFVAFEGQLFVIASSSCIGQEELDFYTTLDPSIKDSFDLGGGMSGIISPYGEYVSPPVINEEGIAYGEIDLDQILDAKHMIDCTGHYARPDVTKLVLNQVKYSALNTNEQPAVMKLSIEDEEQAIEVE